MNKQESFVKGEMRRAALEVIGNLV